MENEEVKNPQEVPKEAVQDKTEESREQEAKPKEKAKDGAKPKNQEAAKAEAPSMLKAVGIEACKRHSLPVVWVTDDGQCFPEQGDAKAHAVNLKNKGIIKVTAE